MELDYQAMCQLIVNDLRNKTPRKSPIMSTGNLRRNTKFFGQASGDIFGHIVIDTDYAEKVNYGYLDHPNSWKLKEDYLYVEKSIKHTLRIICKKYGGRVK